MKTGKCLTYLVLLMITVTLSSCKQDKTILSDSEYYKNNGIIITLNKSEYTDKETAELTIINLSDHDIILGNCGLYPGFDFEKKINGEWFKLYDIICEAIGENYILQSGKKYTFTIFMHLLENRFPNSSGPYRLKLWLYNKVHNNREYLDDSIRVTPEFFLISN
ncbi:hypothetical protein JXQ31_05090 [candidate division KSB1 bacterium]|nr:hypothetical protein [candidate division KSB1 bacterium]